MSENKMGGIWHDPYGLNCIYDIETSQRTERSPHDPVVGKGVELYATTWPMLWGQSVWVSYLKNGTPQDDVGARWVENCGNNSYWKVDFGFFDKGDVVEYFFCTNLESQEVERVGPFGFSVMDWEGTQSVELYEKRKNGVVFRVKANVGNFSPMLAVMFESSNVVRIQLSPSGVLPVVDGDVLCSVVDKEDEVVIITDGLQVSIRKSPYSMVVYDLNRRCRLLGNGDMGHELSWLTDGKGVIGEVRDGFASPLAERFYGFGERYDQLEKRGQVVSTYVYNQYWDQGDRTYAAVPFFYSSNGYGLYLNSTFYSKFDMAASAFDRYVFTAQTGGGMDALLDYFIFGGNSAADVVGGYSRVSGLPQKLPKWVFGLWMSANEWDRQSDILTALEMSRKHDIPATVVVLEQWSDERTFYVWNDSTYGAVLGGDVFTDGDFKHGDRWANPREMVAELHRNNVKTLLWQIPFLQYKEDGYEQNDCDEAYMIERGYAVGDGNGGLYRIPGDGWFHNSLMVDFTNDEAVRWWMSKRAYLFDDIGIDGFKTDGGEMVWRKETSFFDGRKGPEVRNVYSNMYIRAYNDFTLEKTGQGITFARSGTAGVQATGLLWAGDQGSTFGTFRAAMNAGLSAGISGILFWGWDFAGFTGDFPSPELYKRSIEMAAFSPVMQFHSEKANPPVCEERSPWNVASRTGDFSVISVSSRYVNVRMNLLPYIFSEAMCLVVEGSPLMRAMFLDYSDDLNVYDSDVYEVSGQYMFGRSLLVAPVLYEGHTTKNIYLPEGEWVDLWYNALLPGGGTKSYYADVDVIPVYVRSGSILPMNMGPTYGLGETIGNDVDEYTNLTFRVYPCGDSSYRLTHSDGSTMVVSVVEDFVNRRVVVLLPQSNVSITTQVYGSKPQTVLAKSARFKEFFSIDEFIVCSSGFYYSFREKLTYVKTLGGEAKKITLKGILKAPYDAEHAVLVGVSTNRNHLGYLGDGFVDNFDGEGDSVEFLVQAPVSALFNVLIRYSAGDQSAKRTIRVDDSVLSVSFEKTEGWDVWNTVVVPVELSKGRHSICISFEWGDSSGINLDCIILEECGSKGV